MFGLYAKREAYEEKISLDQGCTVLSYLFNKEKRS